MKITIDEWLVHYISDPDKGGIAFNFLYRVYNKCDKFVAIYGSSLMEKIWSMSKNSGFWEAARRKIAKYFFASFISNSDKFIILYPWTLRQPPAALLQQTPNADKYLIETAMNTEDRLIVTTDRKLKEKLSGRQELNIQLVDEFLQKYDC